jgi:dephospho-CoA kinase
MGKERRLVVAVGLTGGIAAGKSTTLRLFGDLGARTLSGDELVHGLYEQPAVSSRVAAHFGPEVLDQRGTVDRAQLARLVRGRPGELRWLEELTHPLVADEIGRQVAAAPGGSVVVCEVPLLFEADCKSLFDMIVTVEASAANRRRRSSHGFGLEQFEELESLQASTERRVAGSDLSFFNDGSPDELRAFVRKAYDRALQLLEGLV